MLRIIILALAGLLAACSSNEPAPIQPWNTLGELRVATRHDAISFFESQDGEHAGFEHDLITALARSLQVPVSFVVTPDIGSAMDALRAGQVHLVAAGLARNDAARDILWSPSLRGLEYVLVGRDEAPDVAALDQMTDRSIVARAGSLAAQMLPRILPAAHNIKLTVEDDFRDQAALQALSDGAHDLVVTDRAHFALAAQVHLNLAVKQELPISAAIAWALPKDDESGLANRVEQFIAEANASGLIERLADRYFSYTRRILPQDAAAFAERVTTRLPKFQPYFEEAEQESGIDWRYLAALAYQESHWDPLARSRTGVRGMMMLTGDTADSLGVTDRLDARQSILGGARYLAQLRESLPEEVAEPDRTWLATAAYNIGMGHLNGARSIAISKNKDPNNWWEMKSVLPLLSRDAYAARLKSGRARGGEAVIMTDNIRNYYNILTRLKPSYSVSADRLKIKSP